MHALIPGHRLASSVSLPILLLAVNAGSAFHHRRAAPPAKLYGRVYSVTTARKTQSIKGFRIIHGRVVFIYRVTGNTQFVPRSSSADVQGFSRGDYAFVISRRSVATTVQFDTTPFKPGPIEIFSGTVTKTKPHGLVIIRDSATLTSKKIYRTADTSYYVGGQPQESLVIKLGEHLTVYAEKRGPRWYAVEIDEA